ncbi:MAG: type II toxin-antitoxin system HicB family antitoxin [Thermaerobacter sp.]|nr:type II toxin-antitoxin system HicB family antitoxin [Thermaerobacter sp.]
MRFVLQVSISPQVDGQGYLAVCPSLQGCHAEGSTVGAALDNLQDVARTLLELRKEDGLPIPEGIVAGEGPEGAMDGRLAVNVS